jgi:hypothetical protein
MPFFKEKQFKEIDSLLNQHNYASVMSQMSKWQPAYLALFQEKFPEHNETLRHADFNLFWQERRESLRLSECPDFRFQTQIDINDADFVTGYVFYLLALKNKENSRMAIYDNYLAQSIELSSFHATQKLLHDLETDKTHQNQGNYKPLLETLHNLERNISRHGSPGYILLANSYLYVAIKTKLIEDSRAISDTAFSCVWKYLNLAKIAMQHSIESIHNAYFGFGLSRSNPFKLPTIESMLTECLKISGDALPLRSQKLITMQAQQDYKKIHEETSTHHLKNT